MHTHTLTHTRTHLHTHKVSLISKAQGSCSTAHAKKTCCPLNSAYLHCIPRLHKQCATSRLCKYMHSPDISTYIRIKDFNEVQQSQDYTNTYTVQSINEQQSWVLCFFTDDLMKHHATTACTRISRNLQATIINNTNIVQQYNVKNLFLTLSLSVHKCTRNEHIISKKLKEVKKLMVELRIKVTCSSNRAASE